MINHIPHTVEAVLDLFTADQLQTAIERHTRLDETLDDWEPRHLLAAEYLCLYAELTYPRLLNQRCYALREKLELLGDKA